MLKRILPLVILTTLLGCHEESDNYEEHGVGVHIKHEVENPATTDEAERILVPFQGHDDYDFTTIIIDSNEGFGSFIEMYESLTPTSDKTTTLQALQGADIDFDQFNLLIHHFSESSWSNELTPLYAPDVHNNIISIKIDRFTPFTGNALSAYYMLIYKINKSFKYINIDGDEYLNKAGENIEPRR